MESHFYLVDIDFEQQFMSGQVPNQDFTHLAHLRLPFLYIRRDGIEQGLRQIPVHLKAYCDAKGAPDKFNLTLTTAAVKTVYHFMHKSQARVFAGLMAEHPELHHNIRALIGHHYGFDIFDSTESKSSSARTWSFTLGFLMLADKLIKVFLWSF